MARRDGDIPETDRELYRSLDAYRFERTLTRCRKVERLGSFSRRCTKAEHTGDHKFGGWA